MISEGRFANTHTFTAVRNANLDYRDATLGIRMHVPRERAGDTIRGTEQYFSLVERQRDHLRLTGLGRRA